MYQISVWTNYFHDLSPEETMATFAKSGWRHLELSYEDSEALLERGDPARAGRRFRKFCAGLGVDFPQGHLWLMVDVAAKDQKKVIEELKRWLDLYLALDIRAAVIHPGGFDLKRRGASPALVLETRARAFRALTNHVKGSPLTLCIENTEAANTAPELLEIIEAVGSPHLALCLDTGHLHIAGASQRDFIRMAGPHLKALHIADNDGKSDQHLMPYGKGTIRWPEVMKALKENGYKGLFNLEIPGETRCPLPVRIAKLDYIKKVVRMMLA